MFAKQKVPLKLALDLRLLQEKWASDSFHLSIVSHQSLNFSTNARVLRELDCFAVFITETGAMQKI